MVHLKSHAAYNAWTADRFDGYYASRRGASSRSRKSPYDRRSADAGAIDCDCHVMPHRCTRDDDRTAASGSLRTRLLILNISNEHNRRGSKREWFHFDAGQDEENLPRATSGV
jgi:hypothetical protein